MRVSVLGAGPSGLYLAILLRKAGHELSVVERNAPDATFGWGVVFSEETLGALRDADYQTYLEITDSFARWTAIDIRYRGATIRSSGHTFSAIRRTHLLDILQRRCRELGVSLEFGREVSTVEPADLVVAADGANSTLRRNGKFGTSSTPQGCKYVWFGTDLVLDAFTFVFKETEHGLFQVHAYPFDEHTSTFIVEAPEPVWRSAGLDTMSEQDSLAFCERLLPEVSRTFAVSIQSLSIELRNAVCIVGGDTGPLHLAVALGTPAVAIFGPTDPARNGPYRMRERSTNVSPIDIVLRSPHAVTTYKRGGQAAPSILEIDVDTVFDAVCRQVGVRQ